MQAYKPTGCRPTHHPRRRLIGEHGAIGAPIAEYVYLDNRPLAMIRGRSNYYYHTDHLNTAPAYA